jgi:hypothetical protein
MIRFYKLDDYKFLKTLKTKFSNPPKVIENGHVILKIDDKKYHSVIDKEYDSYLEILKFIHEQTGKDFYFQKYPNFRYNTSTDIYPVWHSDRHFNHHKEEINVMIPITKEDFGFEIIGEISRFLNWISFKSLNTKFMKFVLDKLSTKINYLDSILIFDGYHLHTASNRKNFIVPRLSIDFRLLPVNHKQKYKISQRGIEIKPGHYFSDKPISEYINN